jgi:hypothetical protein
MKQALAAFIGGFIFLTGCNDKPEVQPANTSNIQVYPNPASHAAYIQVANQNNNSFLLKVFDPKGDLILEEKGGRIRQTFMLQLSNEPKGKYQVILKTDKSVSATSLIKL